MMASNDNIKHIHQWSCLRSARITLEMRMEPLAILLLLVPTGVGVTPPFLGLPHSLRMSRGILNALSKWDLVQRFVSLSLLEFNLG